ncbi:hypothetical protein [Sporomusa termitida]|uniref:Uncharacterized protein n=1 Tax=Sporomusa termitida TaxID=2377 RepID=A0A517DZP1_9FIRM|nr:hypothetical protein [Sporomusa termitida]QDR82817.1 hypothetical protein SPTER_42550 [Sporomusa termitida]
MKTTIKYAHGKGFSKNLSSATVLASPRINREIQENIKKTRLRQAFSESRCCPYPGESYTFYQDKRSARNLPGGRSY